MSKPLTFYDNSHATRPNVELTKQRASAEVFSQTAKQILQRLVAVVFAAAMLGGCASQLASLPVIGLSENAPARPDGPAVYPAVHDLPSPREQALIEPEERARMQKELLAARDQQAKEAPDGGAAVKAAAAAKSSKKKTSQAN